MAMFLYFIFLFTITFEAMNVKDIFFCPKMAAFENFSNFDARLSFCKQLTVPCLAFNVCPEVKVIQ